MSLLVKQQSIVIKVGSNVLTQAQGELDMEVLRSLCTQLATLKAEGHEVILVSSGAVASGRSLATLPDKIDDVSRRQVLAAVGQVKLIALYADIFKDLGLLCAQVLVTKEDFRDRGHYLNMKNCLEALLKNNIIPIVNENDVVSVTELMFTDNDELAGLVSSMLGVDRLVILSNVDGIFTGHPSHAGSKLIAEVDYQNANLEQYISKEKSVFGRGGMLTKSTIAHKVAGMGIHVHIANGKTSGILAKVVAGEKVGTHFLPKKNASNIKRWVATAESQAKTAIVIDEGARKALLSDKPTSLLPVGVRRVEGAFAKGDIIKIKDSEGNLLGIGRTQFASDKLDELKAEKRQKELIHYDYLFLY
jgi:glutamate 5-kinase